MPPYWRRPIIRLAYWTGTRRWACSTKTTATTSATPMAMTAANVAAPLVFWIAHSWEGNVAMIEVKISNDMPLPIPRSVISSASHMITAVPAVIVRTMIPSTKGESLGTRFSEQPWNSWPGVRAIAIRPVACSTARPTVR